MKLTGTYRFKLPRDRVFSAIVDPIILQKVIEGCEKMVKTGENSYDAHLKIGVAGLKGSYIGKVLLQNLRAPESYTLVIEGKGGPGFVKGTAQVKLAEMAEGATIGTELRCEADAQVGGLIAAIGSRLIEAAAKKMMDDFFRKFGEALTV